MDFVAEIARAAGSRFLVGGQVADLKAEGRDLRFIHCGETAAMIVCSLKLGAMNANATPRVLGILEEFSEHLGLHPPYYWSSCGFFFAWLVN